MGFNSELSGGAVAGSPCDVKAPETVDDLLNHIFNLADTVATGAFRIANAVAGAQPSQAGAEPKVSESTLLSRLKDIRRMLQCGETDTYRAKGALGIQ